jgi:cytochrome c5
LSTGTAPGAAVSSPRIEVSSPTFDFGQIMQGDPVKHVFEFHNAGGSDLIINNLHTTCGCTAATASNGPFPPGGKGQIEVSYDSRAKVGFAHKEVEVLSNAEGSPHLLTLTGVVLEDEHPKMVASDVLFAGSCAQCHAVPAKGKSGQELYDSVCAICHDFPQKTGRKYVAPERSGTSMLNAD